MYFIRLFFEFLHYFEGLSSSEASFVQTNIASNDHLSSGGVPQSPRLRSIPNIAHVCTFLALRLEFPWFLVGDDKVCIATENFNVGQVRLYAVPRFVGSHVIEGSCWASVMKVHGGIDCLRPATLWKACLEQHRPCLFHDCPIHSFAYTILVLGRWCRWFV